MKFEYIDSSIIKGYENKKFLDFLNRNYHKILGSTILCIVIRAALSDLWRLA